MSALEFKAAKQASKNHVRVKRIKAIKRPNEELEIAITEGN